VKVIARQYDYRADAPRDLTNDVKDHKYQASVTARQNREAANSVGGKGEPKAVHLDYSMIGVDDEANQTYTDPQAPNATYVPGPPATYYLALVTKKVETPAQKEQDDLKLRPLVESVYGRKMPAPAPPSA
jgi:hypothetical protein